MTTSARTSTERHVIAALPIAANRLIGARTFLIDRAVPDCEYIELPSKMIAEAVLELERRVTCIPAVTASGRFAKLRRRLSPPDVASIAGPFHDCRRFSPQNWAHLLNDQLPLHFYVCEHFDLDPTKVTMLLPENMPGYGRRAVEMFGIPVLCTDAAVEGDALISRYPFSSALRGERAEWAAAKFPRSVVEKIVQHPAGHAKHIFLSRRDTRKVSNMGDIQPILDRYGYVTIYPEALSAEDQLRLFHEASHILAIHGAGLAPLLYRQPDSALKHLVEILPCGHMTDNFRVIAQRVNIGWTGLRGRIKPEYVQPAQSPETTFFNQFSLDDFEVDPVSLEAVLQISHAIN
ncbi:glycosyltransferase family 61 protein [Thioclava kandeliae]|uniref:Glycosyltransferase family 61 protein n=1 Tax=Thioclava kandeliae TaxID=3070818 RepID=A0ABV1SMY0_9RHOB